MPQSSIAASSKELTRYRAIFASDIKVVKPTEEYVKEAMASLGNLKSLLPADVIPENDPAYDENPPLSVGTSMFTKPALLPCATEVCVVARAEPVTTVAPPTVASVPAVTLYVYWDEAPV